MICVLIYSCLSRWILCRVWSKWRFLLNRNFPQMLFVLNQIHLSLTEKGSHTVSLPGNYKEHLMAFCTPSPLDANRPSLYQANAFLFDVQQHIPFALYQSQSVPLSAHLLKRVPSLIYVGTTGLFACLIRGKLAVSHRDIWWDGGQREELSGWHINKELQVRCRFIWVHSLIKGAFQVTKMRGNKLSN